MGAVESGGSSAREKHVVFGAGPVGRAVIAELVGRGARARVVTRSGRRPNGDPATPLRDVVRETVAWYREVGARGRVN